MLRLYAELSYGQDPTKVQNILKYGYDGIQSIVNFILMVNDYILLYKYIIAAAQGLLYVQKRSR
jgi:hypothetical protein